MAGNVSEWTLEYTSNSSSPCAGRGGDYTDSGMSVPASCRESAGITDSYSTFGFRIALY